MEKEIKFPATVLMALVVVAGLQGCVSTAASDPSPAPPQVSPPISDSAAVLENMVDRPAQPISLHGAAEEYGEREISFDFNQATLGLQAVSKLDAAAKAIRAYPEIIIEVSGHADSREHYSQQLSLRRARAAYDHLISKGVDASSLLGPVGYGSSRPIYVGESNPEDRANRANRRVDLNVQN